MDTLEKLSKEEAVLQSMQETYAGKIPSGFSKQANEGRSLYESSEFPTRKDEYWKYTRTNQIATKKWKFSGNSEAHLPEDLPLAKYRLVFVNGVFDSDKSTLPQVEGLRFLPFTSSDEPASQISAKPHIFEALNSAMPQDGYILELSENIVVDDFIQVVFLYDGDTVVSQPRSVITLDEGANLKLTEFHIHGSTGATFANIHTDLDIADNAHLKMDIIQKGGSESFHLQEVFGRMGNNSTVMQNTFTLSGLWTRNNTTIRLDGEHNECNLNGFYIPNQREHIDNHTIIDHEQPNCQSNELYRGVLLDKSTGVFNGKVFVRQDAQKTNAFQSNGNIVVSDAATMNSKPELEIYADDVKCSHGSTTGQLDDEAMFYLQARGLSKDSARKLLINAFAEDVLEKLVNPELREIVEETVNLKLA